MNKLRSIIDGLVFLKEIDANADIASEHDIFYAGFGLLDRMTVDQKKQMQDLGWDEDLASRGWRIFV